VRPGRRSPCGAGSRPPSLKLWTAAAEALAKESRAGFTLLELLIAIFVLAVAVSGTIGVMYAAGRSANFARERTLAADLARTALADALYSAEVAREANGGALSFTYNATSPNDLKLGPAGYQQTGYRRRGGGTDETYGWLWRAHSYDAAVGLYSVDVWVFRNPGQPSVAWGSAPDSAAKTRQTLFYMRSKLENRKP